MKNTGFLLGLALFVPFILSGCNNSKAEIVLFPEEVRTAEITYLYAAEETTWELMPDDIENVKEWAAALELEYKNFESGNSPGDVDGGNVYDFYINDGEASFSYVNSVGSYIVFDGEWYEVENPSDPPVKIPA